jgi:6-pyruvoyltetrahydropterin/6-carboxytetrahydropterin synthase
MPYRVCKVLEVENAHMLSKHPDQCKFPHGHSRRIEFVLESDSLDESDMVCDFKIIKVAVADYIDSFDHAICVNTDDPNFELLKKTYDGHVIAFKNADPTTEVMAREIFDTCTRRLDEYRRSGQAKYPLRSHVRLLRVRVWETSSSWAEYEG